ncbi:MAG: homoserine O-acetyltransferase family protein [Luteibaculaceae bacterium]
MSQLQSIKISNFRLESGYTFPEIEIAYHIFGGLHPKKKVLWICHALTANSNPFEWWPGICSPTGIFNPEEYSIVCANILGSCYGSTGPLNQNPETQKPYLRAFPLITTNDLAQAHSKLANRLGITEIELLVGASLGGMQAMCWATAEPNRIKNLILLACNAQHSPYGIAFNESQRLAIYADATFTGDRADGGRNGLLAARSIAMLSYRSYWGYKQTQAETGFEAKTAYKASSYQRYQGEKLVNRFNAYSYVALTRTMDAHHVGRAFGSTVKALQQIRANTLVIGITSDLLFPTEEQKFLAEHIPRATYQEIDSVFGHDGFLVENEQLSRHFTHFLTTAPQFSA